MKKVSPSKETAPEKKKITYFGEDLMQQEIPHFVLVSQISISDLHKGFEF